MSPALLCSLIWVAFASHFCDWASLCQTHTLSRCFHHYINNKNWHVLNEESLVVPGSTDGYLRKWTASEKCFCHDQHFSDRFLMALIELSLAWTLLQMKWKVVKCAALTLFKVRNMEQLWMLLLNCDPFFFSLKIFFPLSKLKDCNGLAEGASICYDAPGLSCITPINLNGNHKAQSAHLDGNIPLLIRDRLHCVIPALSVSLNMGVTVVTL